MCEPDGSDPFRLTNFGTGGSAWPSWSPDGKTYCVRLSTGGGGDEYQIFTVSAEGGRPQQLTVGPAVECRTKLVDRWLDLLPIQSPDGDLQVWKIPESGGAAVRVTKHGGSRPAVTSDGKFVYYAKGQDEVWRIPAAGGEETRFMTGVEDVFHGRWAPVEQGFYFVQRTGPSRALKFLDFETGRTAEVMPLDKPMDVFALSVSPDRRSVAIQPDRFWRTRSVHDRELPLTIDRKNPQISHRLGLDLCTTQKRLSSGSANTTKSSPGLYRHGYQWLPAR